MNQLPVEWTLRHANKVEYGPYPLDVLVQAAQQGRIVQDTELSHPTLTNGQWVPAMSIREIALAMPNSASVVNQPPNPTVVVAESKATSAAHELRSRRQRERKRSMSSTLRFLLGLAMIAAPMLLLYRSPLVREAFVSRAQKSKPPEDQPPANQSPEIHVQAESPTSQPGERQGGTASTNDSSPRESETATAVPTPRSAGSIVGRQDPTERERPTTPGRQIGTKQPITSEGREPRSLAGFGRSESGESFSLPLADEIKVGIDLKTTDSKLPLNATVRPHQLELEDVTGILTTAFWQVTDGSITTKRDTLMQLQAFGIQQFGLSLTCRIRLSEPVENQGSFLVCDWTWQPRKMGTPVPFSLTEMLNVRGQIAAEIANADRQIVVKTQQKQVWANFLNDPRPRTLEAQKNAEQNFLTLKRDISTLQKQKYDTERVLRDFDSFARYAKELNDRGSLKLSVKK